MDKRLTVLFAVAGGAAVGNLFQGHNILLQSRLFQADPGARSRINTAFVTNNFIWGAVGSALAGFLWSHGGWTAVSVAEMVLSGMALTVWLVGRRGPLVLPTVTARTGDAQRG